MAACMAQKIDVEAIKNGVSYYLGPLLNWTLVGVVQALLEEIERSRLAFRVSYHLVSCILQFPKLTTCGGLGGDTDGEELP
jgi:mediator of RNA polymerase II transcription subunit 5